MDKPTEKDRERAEALSWPVDVSPGPVSAIAVGMEAERARIVAALRAGAAEAWPDNLAAHVISIASKIESGTL